MKLEIIPSPSAKEPRTVLLRHIPENVDDDKAVKKADKLLRGMNVLYTTPIVDGRICLSLIFNLQSKRAGSK